MDFNFLFRKFFHGNPNSSRDPFFDLQTDQRSERDDDAVFHEFESFEPHINIFEEMEDMFNKMFSSFGVIGLPRFEENLPSQSNPRSTMIKDSDEEIYDPSSCNKGFGGLGLSAYDESGKELLEKPHSFSYSKFSSIKTVRLSDGTVEEHRTTIDNDGNKTSTVRRSIDDTSHEVTTKRDKEGIKEKEENFINMAENELSNFEQKWNKLRRGDTVEPSASISLPETSPSYLYLLKKFFGPSQKDEVKWC